MGRTSLGGEGNFPARACPERGSTRAAKLDCPAVDGCRLLYSVGFVLGGVLDSNICHRPSEQSMFRVSTAELPEVYEVWL